VVTSGLAYVAFLAGEDEPASLRNVGRAYYEEENYAEAAKTFERILALIPDSAIDHINLGIVLVQMEQYESARQHLRRGEEIDPQLAPYAAYNIALSYKRERDMAKAAQEFERVLKLDPSDPDATYNLMVVYESLGQLDKALDLATRAVELLPDEVAPHYRRMMIAVRLDKTDIAAEEKEQLTKLRGQDARNRMPAELEMSRYTEIVDPERKVVPEATEAKPSSVRFTDVSSAAGLDAEAGASGAPTSASWVDINGDSSADLFLIRGRTPAFWLNDGSGNFKTFSPGIEIVAEEASHAWGDLDLDGDQDLCVPGKGSVQIFANDGTGKLTRMSDIALESSRVRQLLLVDYDHDGDLDLYVALSDSAPKMFRNDGKGGFAPVDAAGLSPAGSSVDRLFPLDFDDDNDTDFLLVQSGAANLLLSNRRTGTFEDIAVKLGLDRPFNNRNVIVTDLNNDEWRDIVFLEAGGKLTAARGTRSGKFQSIDLGRVPTPGNALTSFDYDNDGDEDILAGGRLFQNDGRFSDFTAAAGLDAFSGQRVVAAIPEDFDHDGDLDLALSLEDGSIRLLRNEGGNRNQWVRIELKGLQSNRFGVGAKVEVRKGSFFQRKICSARPLLFGIGSRRDVDVVRIWWPTGVAQNVLAPPVGQTTVVEEKLGPPSSCPFLYLWDGSSFSFFTDVLDAAALGVPLGDGTLLPHANKEDLLIPGSRVKPRDGRIVMQMTGELREIVYLDSVRLSFVDHPAGTEIFPLDWAGRTPDSFSRLVQLSQLRPPVKAVVDTGEDVTSEVIKQDGVHVAKGIKTTRFNGLVEPHSLILDLGDLSTIRRPALLLQGWINWIDGDTLLALTQGAGAGPFGPRLEIQSANGAWQIVSENIGMPAGIGKHVVVKLPASFCGENTRVRITTNLEIYWDRIAVGTIDNQKPRVSEALPLIESDLHFRGFSRLVRGSAGAPPWYDYTQTVSEAPWKPQHGLFTRYGALSPLLVSADDRLAVFGPGDELTLVFGTPPSEVSQGMVRDYILRVDGWIKDANPSTRTGDQVEPLPTRTMTNYPFGETPSIANRDYWETIDRYNTRVLGRR